MFEIPLCYFRLFFKQVDKQECYLNHCKETDNQHNLQSDKRGLLMGLKLMSKAKNKCVSRKLVS